MTHAQKPLVIADPEFLTRLDADLQEIKRGLQNQKVIRAQQPEFITSDEWMAKTKTSRWKLDALIKEGLLQYKKIGRKFYIPAGEVQRYFDGEMILK